MAWPQMTKNPNVTVNPWGDDGQENCGRVSCLVRLLYGRRNFASARLAT